MSNQDFSNKELFKQLKDFIKEEVRENREEIKKEIIKENKKILSKLEENSKRIDELEDKYRALELRCIQLERNHRKNNVVIYGLEAPEKNVLNFVIDKLNVLLGIQLHISQVNNIFHLKGQKPYPIKVELNSYVTKQVIFENCKKLKNTKIFIVHDLCKEDREDNKILRTHLKAARAKNQLARIKGKTLIVGEDTYTLQQLKEFGGSDTISSFSPVNTNFYRLSTSAPCTPDLTQEGESEFVFSQKEPPNKNSQVQQPRRHSEKRPIASPDTSEEERSKCQKTLEKQERVTRSTNRQNSNTMGKQLLL